MKFLRQLVILSAVIGALGAGSGLSIAAEPAKAKEAPKDLILKGDAKCTGCHDEADDATPTMLELKPSVLAIGKTKHGTVADSRTPTCTDCHGESEKHIKHKGSDKPPKADRTFGKNSITPTAERNEACISCHKRDGKRSHWAGSIHESRDVACTSCHKVHTGHDKVRDKRTQAEVCFTCHKEQRAQANRPSHHPIIEGKVSCSDCHNAHGSAGEKLLVRDNVNDTCFTCHMEKRGPFLRGHQPVSENCGNCHNPHGTTADNLLKARMPYLCQQCHEGTSHRGGVAGVVGGGVGSSSSGIGITQGRACLNCHTNIHGTNNPSSATNERTFRR